MLEIKERYPGHIALITKLGKSHKGTILSEETKKRISETRKRGFAEGRIKKIWSGTKGALAGQTLNDKHWNWKGGKNIDSSGYVRVLMPDHPNTNAAKYMPEHRLIMSNYLQRPLCPWEQVHHKNGIRHDNRIENLLLVIKGVHNGEVKCPFCKKTFGIR